MKRITLELRVIQTLRIALAHTIHRVITQKNSRHIDSGVEGRLGRFGLLSGGVDGRQARLRTRDLARGSGLLSFRAHIEAARLF